MVLDKRLIGIGLSLVGLGLIGYYFSSIITWLVLAWIVSMLGSPLMYVLGKLRIGKFQLSSSVRAMIVLSVFYSLIGLFFYVFVPVIVQQGRALAGINYASIMQGLEEPLSHASDWLIERGLMEGELSKYAPRDTSAQATRLDSTTVVPTPIDTARQSAIDSSLATDSLVQRFANDTINLIVHTTDSTQPLVAETHVPIDSLLAHHPTHRPATINIRVSFDDAPAFAAAKADEHHDSTAIVHPTDTPFEKLKKKIFSYINPSAIITHTASYIINFFGNFVILISSVTFIAFFFLKDEELFARGIKAAISDRHVGKVDAALSKIKSLLTRYFGGIVLQVVSITLYISISLTAFGIENAILIGFFGALINVVPYVGLIIGTLFGMVVAISSHLDAPFYTEMLPILMTVGGVFLTMHLLDGFVLQPIIFSNSVLAHPLEIFIVVIVGAKLGGITGMVAALPIYTIFRVIAASFLSEYKLVQQLTQHLDDELEEDNDAPKEQTPPIA